MENEQIEVGDVVILKSGGPRMTVDLIDGEDVQCTWFDDKNALEQRSFKSNLLRKPSVGVSLI